MTCAPRSIPRGNAFSLLEIVVVVVILGIVASIALPRFSIAAGRARASTLRADLSVLNRATDLYIAEHGGLQPAQDQTGAISADGDELTARLTQLTDELGSVGSVFGPYLLKMPANPFNGLRTVRVDGAPAGAGTHGWHYDSARRLFRADDSVETASVSSASAAVISIDRAADGAAELLGKAGVLAADADE